MPPVLVVFACALGLIKQAHGHIHSQKVQHIEREKLTTNTWLFALVSSALVGACGVFPLLINKWVRLDKNCKDRLAFKAVLSFAVGGLLGDVFLHLLPEAYGTSSAEGHQIGIGMWVLVGLLSFLTVEKLIKVTKIEESGGDHEKLHSKVEDRANVSVLEYERLCSSNGTKWNLSNGTKWHDHVPGSGNGLTRKALSNGGVADSHTHKHSIKPPDVFVSKWFDKDVSGYLNLVANSTDNFTHGLAIAASYVASPAVGMLTTLAILCHEIPHEVGDFAILLNSGFSLKGAAKAQMLTACGGIVGVVTGLTAEHVSSASSWLLPFTAGGFLYIALVSIIPELLECPDIRHSVIEIVTLSVGVSIMALVTIVEKKSCMYMPQS